MTQTCISAEHVTGCNIKNLHNTTSVKKHQWSYLIYCQRPDIHLWKPSAIWNGDAGLWGIWETLKSPGFGVEESRDQNVYTHVVSCLECVILKAN